MLVRTMKYIITLLIAFVFMGAIATAQEVPVYRDILISEVQLGSANSATEEFVEIVNTGLEPVELTGLKLEYKSKNGSSWSSKASLEGEIAPYGRYLISNYLDGKSTEFKGGLSGTSGHLRLSDSGGATVDLIAWGDAAEPDGAATVGHGKGESLKRMTDEDGRFVDTDDNSSDWFLSQTPSPEFDTWPLNSEDENSTDDGAPQTDPDQTDDLEVSPEDPSATSDPANPPATDEEVEPVSSPPPTNPDINRGISHKLDIVELMPDPVSPLTDAEHEYVELYNPNSFAVELAGYKLEAGKDWRYSHTLGAYSLEPGEYLAVFSGTTGVTLSNSGTDVHLVSPSGDEVSAVAYPKAKAGKSWNVVAGNWAWGAPTLHSENIHDAAAETEDEPPKVLGSNTESSGTEPLQKQNVDFPGDGGGTGKAAAKATDKFTEQSAEPQKINNWVLAGVGTLAILYAVYEYRNDIRIRVKQCRRYFEVRKLHRTESKGR